jgi:hypothetical protein
MAFTRKRLKPLLPQIKSPSLVLWGENDLFTPLKLGQELAQGIKGSRLIVVEGEYHEWSMFRPEKFAPISLILLMKTTLYPEGEDGLLCSGRLTSEA